MIKYLLDKLVLQHVEFQLFELIIKTQDEL